MADDLIVSVNIDETDFRYIKIGSKVAMFLDAYAKKHFEGIVEHVSYDAQIISNVTVYEVKIRPLQKPETFRSGMTVTTIITAESKNNVLAIPTTFITSASGGKKTVTLKVGSPKKFELVTKSIRTGISNDRNTEVLPQELGTEDTVVLLKQKKKVESRADKK
jgi:multidrug efflux pump subunit AcrA (membrane-fusion protein)